LILPIDTVKLLDL